MLRVAELFTTAQDVLVEVVGRIRPEHRHLVLPPLSAGEEPSALPAYVDALAREDARLPALLAGHDPGAPGPGPDFAETAAAACAAARAAADPAVVVPGGGTVEEHLELLAIRRAFAAHDIAMHLGSRACPLTEELARGLWERTEPDVERWRERGVFGPQFEPMPPDVSWRDRFLNTAGRDPHALDPAALERAGAG